MLSISVGQSYQKLANIKDQCAGSTPPVKPLNKRFFIKRLRWQAHVQIRKGDQFIDMKFVEMNKVRAAITVLEGKDGTGVALLQLELISI